MKALIPAAGQGTRLYPQTHTKPKAMVRLAGQPILGHILESIAATDINEVVIVVGGPMQDQIVEYASGMFHERFGLDFVEQAEAEGLGHSIYQAAATVGDEPLLIALGDMLFEHGYEQFLNAHRELGNIDGSIGVKHVDDPQYYGIVELDEGRIARLVEKPSDPPSNLAISGVYVIKDSRSLFDALEHLLEHDLRGEGDEFQLTDALQRMVETGSVLETFGVEDWYDCGRPETLLEANRVLLAELGPDESTAEDRSVLVPPVDMGCDVAVESSVVGPNVSVDDGATIEKSIVSDSIVGRGARIKNTNLTHSIIGDHAEVHGETSELNVGDNSSLHL